MPIDSLCAGCGKTLRVNDEFVGRKARCPMCGLVYVVGGGVGNATNESTSLSNPFVAETTYSPQTEVANLPTLEPLSDSWSSLASEKPTANEPSPQPAQTEAQIVASPFSDNATPLTSPLASSIPAPVTKYFVRTPNTMVYGPSDTEMVLDWIKQGRLDDTCHIREENSEQWLGLAAWRFQLRKLQNPLVSPVNPGASQFGAAPISTVQSVGYQKSGNGMVVLILGLVSWILCPTAVGALVCAILAIVFASMELGKIRNGQSPSKEKMLVLIGLWLGIANLIAWAMLIVGFIVLAATTN